MVTGFCYNVIVEVLESGRKNIVVLGAGFGGITALLKLRRLLRRHRLFPAYNLVLVSKSAQHLYTPALYEIASLPRGQADALCLKSTICIQIEDIIARYPEIRFLGEAVAALEPQRHLITFISGNRISFEYTIIALGAETNFFNVPGLTQHAYPLKTFEDAVRFRNHTEALIEGGCKVFNVIVGGGGATGVEFAAEFVLFFRSLNRRMGQRCDLAITIVEAAPTILSGFDSALVRRASSRLQALGIRIITNAPISRVTPDKISLANGQGLPYELLVWSGGVMPARVLKNFNLPLGAKGGLIVNEFMEALPRIYAVGDNASFVHPQTGRPLPGNVPVAEAEARLAAKNILADITTGKKRPFKPLTRYPFVLAVGGKFALTDLIIVKSFGFAGWILKQLVELRYFLFILPWPKAIPMWLRAVYYSTRND